MGDSAKKIWLPLKVNLDEMNQPRSSSDEASSRTYHVDSGTHQTSTSIDSPLKVITDPLREPTSESPIMESVSTPEDEGLPLSEFSDEAHDSTFHFQILKLMDQLYIWIGCNSARLGNLFASFPLPFDRTPSLTALIGGGPDNTGATMARRLSMKTGWSIILAVNLPSNSPTLEAYAERRLLQELRSLGYVKSSANAQQLNGLAQGQ